MKALKWVGAIVAVYIVFVMAFETLFLGLYQPKLKRMGIPMLALTTTDGSGMSRERRLARFEPFGHRPGANEARPEERNPAFPLTLDLRRPVGL